MNCTLFKKRIGYVCIYLFILSALGAQSMRDSSDVIVITDSKVERSIRSTTRPVTIINYETIQQYLGKGLDQLLGDQAGIQINGAHSNPGAQKSVFIRGAAASYTLILIDGLPVTDASTIGSTVDLRTLDLNQIERVEIAKGSQSTLYGSDAIAGVINIITKKGGTKPFGFNANLSYASWQTADLGASLNGSSNNVQYNLGYQLTKTDGISEAFDPSDSGAFDDDGYEKQVISANLKYALNNKWSIAPSVQITSLTGGYDDGAFTDGTDTYESDMTNIGLRVVYNNDQFKINAGVNNAEVDRSFLTGFGDFTFNGTTQNADIYTTINTGDITIVGGIHYQNASITDQGTTEIDPSWNIIAPYANLIYSKNNFQLEGGLRFNSHSNFGGNTNFGITPSLFVSKNLKIFTSYTTAFKAPALYELYGAFGANPDLKPQTSATFELGSKLFFETGDASITYFNRKVDDVILFVSMYENFAEQKDQGVELETNFTVKDGFSIQASYTYLDGFTTDGNGTKTHNLFKRPAHQVGLNIVYDVDDQWNIRMINQWNSDRTDLFFDFNTFTSQVAEMKAYLRTDVSVNYKASKKIRLFAHLNNVWDNPYFETYGFSTQGTNFRIGGVLIL